VVVEWIVMCGSIGGQSRLTSYLRFVTLLFKAIGDGGSGRLVEDTKDLRTGGACIPGGLTLGIVEVCGDRDDGMGDPLPR
jgi:hypothetical protein